MVSSGLESSSEMDLSPNTPATPKLTEEHRSFIAESILEICKKSHGDEKDPALRQTIVQDFQEKFGAELSMKQLENELKNIRRTRLELKKKKKEFASQCRAREAEKEDLQEKSQNVKIQAGKSEVKIRTFRSKNTGREINHSTNCFA